MTDTTDCTILIHLPRTLRTSFKVWCVQNNTTMTQAIKQLMEEAVKEGNDG